MHECLEAAAGNDLAACGVGCVGRRVQQRGVASTHPLAGGVEEGGRVLEVEAAATLPQVRTKRRVRRLLEEEPPLQGLG